MSRSRRTLRAWLRSLGLGLLTCAIWLALPGRVEAQGHGATIEKSCVGQKNTCGSNADCADPLSCSGQGICTSSGANHMIECTIILTNTDASGDSLRVLAASDTIFAAGGDQTFTNLPVSSTSGTVSGDCTGSIDPLVGCTLSSGASVSFISNQYVIQPTDPNPLQNQGEVRVQDLCNVNPTFCSALPFSLTIGSSTSLVSGCLPGPTCTPTATAATPTSTPTTTSTSTPTSTPTNTPTGPPPPPPADVPTLSFPMMALLGLMLAGAGLFLARRT
jgi:hypothetical protein